MPPSPPVPTALHVIYDVMYKSAKFAPAWNKILEILETFVHRTIIAHYVYMNGRIARYTVLGIWPWNIMNDDNIIM